MFNWNVNSILLVRLCNIRQKFLLNCSCDASPSFHWDKLLPPVIIIFHYHLPLLTIFTYICNGIIIILFTTDDLISFLWCTLYNNSYYGSRKWIELELKYQRDIYFLFTNSYQVNLEDVFFNLTEEKSGYNFNMVTGYERQNRTNIGIYLFEDSSSCESSSSLTAQQTSVNIVINKYWITLIWESTRNGNLMKLYIQ